MLQNTKYYIKLNNDINMEGLAIPPIGTETYPFIGNFNGDYRTVSNLFITNNKAELKTHFNITQIELGSQVGFFGRIDSRDTPYVSDTAGEAYRFYLEKVNISSNVNNSVIGIAAGFNNGSLYDIGVSNNSFKLSNIIGKSDYTLVGAVGNNSSWVDSPSYFGNKILIDPNDPNNLFTALQPLNNVQKYREVSGSIPQHAYFTSTLTYTNSDAPQLYKITSNDKEESGNVTTLTPSSRIQITSSEIAVKNGIPSEFWSRFSTATNSTRYIVPATNPSPSATMAVPFESGSLNIPYNGIWFKPKGSGKCGIAFSITDQSNDSAMAVYEFQRDASNNIINWNETRFILQKKTYGNKSVVYFEYDVKKDYEYVVGKSTISPNTAGFFYLILEGVGSEGGGMPNMSTTQHIDFVMRDVNNQFPNLSDENYALNRTYLSFEGTSSSSGYMYFNKTTYNSKTAVYYYSSVSSYTVKENVYINPQSLLASQSDFQYVFPDWMSYYLNEP